MIAKMKKFSFLVFHDDYKSFVDSARDAGVFHVVEKESGITNDADLQNRLSKSAELQKKLNEYGKYIPSSSKGKEVPVPVVLENGIDAFEKIDDLINLINAEKRNISTYEKNAALLRVWGDFNPADIKKLNSEGYDLRLYSCPSADYDEKWEEDHDIFKISESKSLINFIVVCKNNDADIDAERFYYGPDSLSVLEYKIKKANSDIQAAEEKIDGLLSGNMDSMKSVISDLKKGIEFSKVILSGDNEVENRIIFLEAWAPAKRLNEIEAGINKMDACLYYEVNNPQPGDKVPILLSNNKFSKLFEPLSEIYMLPKYAELDMTPFFAPFFMVFFGLCLGDSGYGLLLFLVALGAKMFKKDLKPGLKSILSLVQVFGLSAFVLGFLSGTFFGVSVYTLNVPFFQKMKSAVYFDNNSMFQLSLILGVIQIMFGMCLKVVNKIIQFGIVYALTTIGWVLLFMSIIFSALFPGILPMFKTVHLCILCVAAILILFYNSPGKNPFFNFGAGLWDTYNMATGVLGDVLSYVRLFALGLSGGVLGSVFNSLAVGLSPDIPVVKQLVFLIIVLIGHGMNIFMSSLGALVHPMRLTFVEFYKNAGFEGGSEKYKAFGADSEE